MGINLPAGFFMVHSADQGDTMARITFWEKPGCSGNARQKEILRASGHALEVRNLLTGPWTVAELSRFFGQRPVAKPVMRWGRGG